eukprot:9476815-Pyramimonas_sp.AAC.1
MRGGEKVEFLLGRSYFIPRRRHESMMRDGIVSRGFGNEAPCTIINLQPEVFTLQEGSDMLRDDWRRTVD